MIETKERNNQPKITTTKQRSLQLYSAIFYINQAQFLHGCVYLSLGNPTDRIGF